jgi:hypothetical protein
LRLAHVRIPGHVVLYAQEIAAGKRARQNVGVSCRSPGPEIGCGTLSFQCSSASEDQLNLLVPILALKVDRRCYTTTGLIKGCLQLRPLHPNH